MQVLETVSHCPICKNNSFKALFESYDYMVSKEKFTVCQCTSCGFHLTNPRPTVNTLSQYYEVNKYLSHNKSGGGLIGLVYGLAKKITLKRKLQIIQAKLKTKGKNLSILDVGSGTGDFLKACLREGYKVSGVEPSEEARRSIPHDDAIKLYAQLADATNQQFDVITFWHVLEHIYEIEESIHKVKRLLNEDGFLFIALPNPNAYDAKLYQNIWAAWDLPRHIWHFTKIDMERFANKNGLRIEDIIPMKLDAYYVSLLSEKYRNPQGKLLPMINAFINGIRSNHSAKKTGEYSSLLYILRK